MLVLQEVLLPSHWRAKVALAAHTRPMWYIYVSYVHNPQSARNILRTRLKKGNGRLGKLAKRR